MDDYLKLRKYQVYVQTAEIIFGLIGEIAGDIKSESERERPDFDAIEVMRKRLSSLSEEMIQLQPEDSFASISIQRKYAPEISARIIGKDILKKASQ